MQEEEAESHNTIYDASQELLMAAENNQGYSRCARSCAIVKADENAKAPSVVATAEPQRLARVGLRIHCYLKIN